MVKFSKQFEGQLVPEWKEAFVDYCQLKKDVKKIHLLNDPNTKYNSNTKTKKSSFPESIISSLRKYTFLDHKQREPRVIQVLSPSLYPFSQSSSFIFFFLFLTALFSYVT